jgi:hypothetical protein
MLRRVWSAIRHGESLDLYLTLCVAVAATLLGLLGLGGSRALPALTTTLLGLIAIGLLQQRYYLEKLEKNAGQKGLAVLSVDKPYDLGEELENCTSAIIGGVDLARTCQTYEDSLRRYLRAGHRLRVLLYDPDDSSVDVAVERSLKRFSKERQANLIRGSLDDFALLQTSVRDAEFEVRLSRFPFYFGFATFDLGSPGARLFVKHYAYRAPQYDGPWIRFAPGEQQWLDQYGGEIEALWEQGTLFV